MAKVTAVFEIVRPGETVQPGTQFTATGEELEYLLKVGAVRKSTKEDDQLVNLGADGDETTTVAQKDVTQATPVKTESATSTKAAKSSGKGKVAPKSTDDDGI